MQVGRFFWFTVVILIGTVLGVVYGWMINPVRYVDTDPQSLRQDYKADYVLMVAEVYADEQSLPLAFVRLEQLGASTPLRAVQEAIVAGQKLGYSSSDMQLLGSLSEAMSAMQTGQQTETSTP